MQYKWKESSSEIWYDDELNLIEGYSEYEAAELAAEYTYDRTGEPVNLYSIDLIPVVVLGDTGEIVEAGDLIEMEVEVDWSPTFYGRRRIR